MVVWSWERLRRAPFCEGNEADIADLSEILSDLSAFDEDQISAEDSLLSFKSLTPSSVGSLQLPAPEATHADLEVDQQKKLAKSATSQGNMVKTRLGSVLHEFGYPMPEARDRAHMKFHTAGDLAIDNVSPFPTSRFNPSSRGASSSMSSKAGLDALLRRHKRIHRSVSLSECSTTVNSSCSTCNSSLSLNSSANASISTRAPVGTAMSPYYKCPVEQQRSLNRRRHVAATSEAGAEGPSVKAGVNPKPDRGVIHGLQSGSRFKVPDLAPAERNATRGQCNDIGDTSDRMLACGRTQALQHSSQSASRSAADSIQESPCRGFSWNDISSAAFSKEQRPRLASTSSHISVTEAASPVATGLASVYFNRASGADEAGGSASYCEEHRRSPKAMEIERGITHRPVSKERKPGSHESRHSVSKEQPLSRPHSEAPRPPPSSPNVSPRRAARDRCREQQSWVRRGLGHIPLVMETNNGTAKRDSDHVKVFCRCRPCTPNDWKNCSGRGAHIVHIQDGNSVEARNLASSHVVRHFQMDAAFGGDSTQDQVFAELQPFVQMALDGGQSCILAYGPTGSGKTYAMHGSSNSPGLVLLAAAQLLQEINGKQIHMSMVELYNESLYDLLVERGQKATGLKLRGGSSSFMPCIEGARTVSSSSLHVFSAAVHAGFARRHVASTILNTVSSRAHLVVTFKVGAGSLTMLDLSGTERLKRSGAEGSTLREVQSINRSLHVLSDVVDALRRGSGHVPFRNSQLTRLIASALRRGPLTAVIVCLAPLVPCCEEVLGALCFAERVRLIPSTL